MNSFRNHRLRDFAVPMSTNWLLNDLAEAKGKQELYTRQSPQILKALREMATSFPQTPAAFLKINGVGNQKLTKFGDQFMTAIRMYVSAQSR